MRANHHHAKGSFDENTDYDCNLFVKLLTGRKMLAKKKKKNINYV